MMMRIDNRRKRNWMMVAVSCALVWLLAGCAQPPEISLPPTATEGIRATATSPASPTPTPPSNLFICLAQEPTSLYLYADTSREADIIFQALYQGPMDLVDFQWQSSVLEKVPSLAEGDAQIEVVSVGFSDVYLNPETLEPERLGNGDPYLPAGCRSTQCSQVFQGGQVDMDRLRAEFQLKAGQSWSDGEPLTASDSIFSFELAGHPDTPVSKYLFTRTFAYRQLDELSVEWIGIPGFLDSDYASNFWTPLPEHKLGQIPPADLLGLPEASINPMGYGPYQIEQWQQGSQLVMRPNPEYGGEQAAGSAFDRLVFRFIGSDVTNALDQFATGECDVLDEGLLPLASFEQVQLAVEQADGILQIGAGSVVERLEFAMRPALGSEYLHLLDELEIRQAVASCIDREGLARDLFGQEGPVPVSFIPTGHPISSLGSGAIVFKPEVGRQLLQELGWLLPEEGDTRVALGVDGLANDTPLSFTVYSLPGQLQATALSSIQQDLADCGVGMQIETMPADQLFEIWPDGPIFGRKFQFALWAWPTFHSPACEMFAGWEFPSQENPLGINASGYLSPAYDQACRSLLLSPSGTEAYAAAIEQVQAAFIADLPALPLFVRPRVLAHAPWLCGPRPGGSAATMFWNLEEWAACP